MNGQSKSILRLFICGGLSVVTLGCSTTIRSVLKQYGFQEVRPPTRNLAPGTVLSVTGRNPLTGGIVCTATGALGSGVERDYIPSPTNEQTIREKASLGLSLSGDYLKEIKGEAKYSAVKNVTVRFTKVRVLELPEGTARQRLDRIEKGCADSIRANPRSIAMIQKSLEADVVYSVEFDKSAGLSLETQEGLVEGLAAKLNGSVAKDGARSITGTSLYWGVVEFARFLRPGSSDFNEALLPARDQVTKPKLRPEEALIGESQSKAYLGGRVRITAGKCEPGQPVDLTVFADGKTECPGMKQIAGPSCRFFLEGSPLEAVVSGVGESDVRVTVLPTSN